MVTFGVAIAVLLALLAIARWWGQASGRAKQAEAVAEERAEDARIAAGPFVDKPFGGMRRKD